MKSVMMVVVMAAATAFAGKTCTWKGTSAAASWQSAENWDVAPTSGNGDTLVFETGVGGVNGTAGFSVGQIVCLGSQPVTIGGEAFVLTGAFAVSNTVPLTVDAPMTIAADTTLAHFNKATYNKTVAVDGAHNVYIGPNDKAIYAVTFNAAFEAEKANISLRQGNATNIKNVSPVRFNGPLHAARVWVASGYKTSLLELATTGNSWTACSCCFGHFRACCENAYPSNAVLDWGVSATWSASHVYLQTDILPGMKDYSGNHTDLYDAYDLNGFDQTIDRIRSTVYPTKNNVQDPESFSVCSDTPATLTMNATADGVCYARVMGALSLVWSPDEDRMLTFSNRVHATTGGITVAKGTVKTVGTCVFSNLTSVVVGDGATFVLDSDAKDALMSLAVLKLGKNATFRVGSKALTPFGSSKPAVSAEEGAQIVVPDGMTIAASALMDRGAYRFGETLTTGLVTGGGSLSVDAAPAGSAYWKSAQSGAWTDGSKWSADAVPDETDSVFINAASQDYAVRIESPVSLVGSMLLANPAGYVNAVTLAVSNTLSYTGTDLKIGSGAALTVGTGGVFAMKPPSTTGIDDPVFTVSGGSLTVDGGTVDLTGGDAADKSDENFRGRITVEGADGLPGEVRVKSGTFKLIPWWGGKDGNRGARMTIGDGGKLSVSGGLCHIHTGWWWNEPLVLDGGEVDVSGTGVLEIECRSPLENGNKIGGVAGFFGTGTVTFRDSAELRQPDNTNASIYMPSSRDETPRDLQISFSDHAKLDFVCDLLLGGFVNMVIKEPYKSHRSSLTLDSDADHVIGRRLAVGVNVGTSEVTMVRGSLSLPKGTLSIPYHNCHNKSTTLAVGPKGFFRMDGGRLYVKSGMWTSSRDPAGFLIGNTLPLPVGGSYAFNGGIGDFEGTFEMTDGVVTNDAGAVIVGSALGKGAFRQSGGSFVHTYEQFALVGFLGGEGTYEVSGGSNAIRGDMYVGGATTNTLGWGALMTTGIVENAVFDVAERHDAKGLLKVTGGTFGLLHSKSGVRGNLVFSDDGTGTLEIGAAGAVNVRNVTFRNGAASTAKFVFGPDGSVGTVTAEEKLTVSTGTKLVVDLTACTEPTRSHRLFSAPSVEGEFDVEVVGGEGKPYRVTQNEKGVKVGFGGMMLIVR